MDESRNTDAASSPCISAATGRLGHTESFLCAAQGLKDLIGFQRYSCKEFFSVAMFVSTLFVDVEITISSLDQRSTYLHSGEDP